MRTFLLCAWTFVSGLLMGFDTATIKICGGGNPIGLVAFAWPVAVVAILFGWEAEGAHPVCDGVGGVKQ